MHEYTWTQHGTSRTGFLSPTVPTVRTEIKFLEDLFILYL